MRSLHRRSWNILFQHLPKASLPLLFFLTIPNLQAIHDTNHNGVSDLWEKKYNQGNLYPTFNSTADPDGDGWTNAQEAAAGTNPTSGTGLTGLIRPEITHTPAVYRSPEEEGGQPVLDSPEVMTITWPTIVGKKYTLLFSTDLTATSWTAIGSPRIGAGSEIGTSIPLTQPDGSTPERLFWRVTITDIDSDSDTLTNAEEAELGSNPYSSDGDNDGLSDVDELFVYHTNPSSPDTDGDGVSDSEEIASGHDPKSNQSYPPRWNIALRTAHTGVSNSIGRINSNWPPYFFQEIPNKDIPVSTLPTWVATMPFPDQAPDNLLLPHQISPYWEGSAPFYGLIYGAAHGWLTQGRYWLQTKPASNVEIKRTFLKVTSSWRTTYSPVDEVLPSIVEKLEVTIPANSTASLPIDIMPPLNFPPEFYTVIRKVISLLPVEFEVKHTEIDPTTGQVVNPGANKMLRDEIVDIRIKVPTIGSTDWTVDLSVEPEAMRNENLPNRGNVQMYDLGQVEDNGAVTPDKTQFVLPTSTGGERTIKAVFNKEGTLKIRVKSTDGKIDLTSPDYTIQKRMRKYANLPNSQNHDLNQHDKAFVDAANHWGGVYQHQVDDAERLKAMGMAESELGLTDATDILTVGNPGDHVLDTFRNVPPYDRFPGATPAGGLALREVVVTNNSTRMLSYPAADETPAATAIHWGVCWLYQKASSIANTTPYTPGPWRTWDNATERYNGGGVPNYLQRINRSMKEGRHPSNANLYIWPMKSNKKARGN